MTTTRINTQKYQFTILFNEAPEDIEIQVKNINGLSELLTDNNPKAKYAYKLFAKDRESKEMFLKKFADLTGSDMKIVSFSRFPREVSSEEMIFLINIVKETNLFNQLSAYKESSTLVKYTMDHLKMSVQELAEILDSRPQDVYNWLSMNAKPDRLKIVILEYLLSCADWTNDPFINFLVAKFYSPVIQVNVINNLTLQAINPFEKTFMSLDKAQAHAKKVAYTLRGLNVKINITNSNNEILGEYSTLKK